MWSGSGSGFEPGETEEEPELKLFQSRNRNRNKFLRSHNNFWISNKGPDPDLNQCPDPTSGLIRERKCESTVVCIVHKIRCNKVFYHAGGF